MRVAVGQMEPKLCDRMENLTRVQHILEKANSAGVDVLVLPELCNSGYVFQTINEALDSSEQIPKGPMSRLLQEWSKNNHLAVAGICEQADDVLYNSAAVFRNGEYVLTYRKVHLFLDELDWFTPGEEEPPVIEYHDSYFGITILCYLLHVII